MSAEPLGRFKTESERHLAPRETLIPLLEAQGYRELATAHLFAAGLLYAPTLDDKQMLVAHATDELAHFEGLAALYDDVAGADLFAAVAEAVSQVPVPSSWTEVCVARFLLDRAVYWELRSHADAPHLGPLTQRLLADELEHLEASETVLVDHCRDPGVEPGRIEALAARWLHVAVALMAARRFLGAERTGLDDRVAQFVQAVRPVLERVHAWTPAVEAAAVP